MRRILRTSIYRANFWIAYLKKDGDDLFLIRFRNYYKLGQFHFFTVHNEHGLSYEVIILNIGFTCMGG